MEIKFSFLWHMDHDDKTQVIDPVLFQLLAIIKKAGSLKEATLQAGVSYRFAWGLLNKWEAILGQPLVILERGRGASLSPVGEKLLNANQNLLASFSPDLDNYATQIRRQIEMLLTHGAAHSLNIFASHGIAVSALRDLIHHQTDFKLDLHFHGSLRSLRALHTGECDIAGFHIPASPVAYEWVPDYLNLINEDTHQLIYVVKRNQGLMITPGNPKNISSLSSLTRPDISFINRQLDSGTRLLLDKLLISEHIDPKKINGYQQEEFTHMAVAAMVASGVADVGFGIAPMAHKFNLEFMPLIWEHYCLAVPIKLVDDDRVAKIISLLKSDDYRSLLKEYVGYDASNSGQIVSFKQMFHQHPH